MNSKAFKQIRKENKLTMPALSKILEREGAPCSVSMIKKIETTGEYRVSTDVKMVMILLAMYGPCNDLKKAICDDLELAPGDEEAYKAVQHMVKSLI